MSYDFKTVNIKPLTIYVDHVTSFNYFNLMFVSINGKLYGVRISKEVYLQLRALGVPTGQKLRYFKNKKL